MLTLAPRHSLPCIGDIGFKEDHLHSLNYGGQGLGTDSLCPPLRRDHAHIAKLLDRRRRHLFRRCHPRAIAMRARVVRGVGRLAVRVRPDRRGERGAQILQPTLTTNHKLHLEQEWGAG